MNFENYAERLVSLTNFDTFEKPPADYKEVSHLTVFQDNTHKKTVKKLNFPSLEIRDSIFLVE